MMLSSFDVKFGQTLCDLLSSELGLVCSFMGEGGRIIASSERERIGSPHPIAAKIMCGVMDEYGISRQEAAQSALLREGLIMAIDFGGQRLASFAIAGPLEVVRPLARLVRFSVTSLLRVRQHESGTVDTLNDAMATDESGVPVTPDINLPTLLSQASQNLESNLTRLRDAVDTIDQGLTMFDSGYRLVVWNRRFLELLELAPQAITFGLTLEAVIRCAAQQAQHTPADIAAMVSQRLALAQTRQTHRIEHVMPHGVVLEVVDRPLANGGFVSTYTDVTQRRRAELALRAAYDNAERLVQVRTREMMDFAELSPDWFWEQDAQLRFTRFFGLATDKLRRLKSDFFGKRRWEMPIHGVSTEQIAGHIAACERHEPFRKFEYQITSSDGQTQYFSVSGSPVFDEQHSFTGYHGIGTNITELRLAELAVKERERLLAQIVDGSPIPTFVIDAQHQVTHWNQACVALTGFSAEQMLGKQDVWRAFYPNPQPILADLVVSDASDDVLGAHYQKFSRSPLIAGALEAEDCNQQLGDGDRWHYFTAAPLRDTNGVICGAIETIQDITERHRNQELLVNRSQALQSAHDELEARVAERTAALSQQLHFSQQLLEAIPGPVFYKDADCRYLGCNTAFLTYLGKPVDDLIGKSPQDIAPPALAAKYLAADRALLDHPGTQIYEAQVRYADGVLHDVMFHKATFSRPDGSTGGLVGVMLDITERKRMENSLRQAASVFDNSAQGLTITAADGAIIAINRAFTEITGYEESEVIGLNPRLLQSGRHDNAFYIEMWDGLERHGRWQGEVWNRRKNGEIFPQWISISAVYDHNQVTNYVAAFSDITQQKQTEEEIQLLAFTDALTNLPNRRLLLDRLHHALAGSLRSQRHGALLFIDLDNFKTLNDTRGHHVGDQLLKEVARRLTDCVRNGDTVARFGGDEFVVLLENLDANLAEAVRQTESVGAKILARLNQPYLLTVGIFHNTPSIGVTMFGDQQSSLDDLLRQADLAMYRSKSVGRNALRFFDPEMQVTVASRVALESDLRLGLQKQQFVLYYQPQVDDADHVTGAEALLRWQHPERGLVSPLEFIPLAEETKLIVPLGHWVMVKACEQLCAWAQHPDTRHLTMAVNVSAHQFRQADFVEQVTGLIDRFAIEPNKLKLEVTESMLLDDLEDVIAKMSALKSCGVFFSLDDFGTGYSSLQYLKRLPLSQLKIDQSFVRDVLSDANAAAIACTVITLARSLGLAVIAEGVETQAQLEFLAASNCHAYQGYLFSRPLPQEAFAAYIKRRNAAL